MPTLPPDIDPGPAEDAATESAARFWRLGFQVLLGLWILVLGVGAGRLLAWAWEAGLIGAWR